MHAIKTICIGDHLSVTHMEQKTTENMSQLKQIKSDNSLGPLTILENVSAGASTLFSSIVKVLDHYPIHN